AKLPRSMATLMPDSKVPASSAIKRVSATGASKYDVKLSSLKPPAAPRTMLTNLAAALREGAPLNWCRAEAVKAATRCAPPSADTVAGGGSVRPVPLSAVTTRKTIAHVARRHKLLFDMLGLPGCHQSQQHHARDGAQRAKNKILRPAEVCGDDAHRRRDNRSWHPHQTGEQGICIAV